MPKFLYLVTIDTDTRDDADIVIGERIGYDEAYYTDDAGEVTNEPRDGDRALEYSLDYTFLERNDA